MTDRDPSAVAGDDDPLSPALSLLLIVPVGTTWLASWLLIASLGPVEHGFQFRHALPTASLIAAAVAVVFAVAGVVGVVKDGRLAQARWRDPHARHAQVLTAFVAAPGNGCVGFLDALQRTEGFLAGDPDRYPGRRGCRGYARAVAALEAEWAKVSA
jgi:hypothetical protein